MSVSEGAERTFSDDPAVLARKRRFMTRMIVVLVGGMFLGLIESMGPAALGIPFQLKDVLAFMILILVLTFRPSGLLGERLSEEKL